MVAGSQIAQHKQSNTTTLGPQGHGTNGAGPQMANSHSGTEQPSTWPGDFC